MLGFICAIGIGVCAYTISSSDVSYDNSTSGLEANNVKDAVDDLYEMAADGIGKVDLLWTNSKPTSSFAAQTIALDLSEYSAVVVKMCQTTTAQSTPYCTREFIEVDSKSYYVTVPCTDYWRTVSYSRSNAGRNVTVKPTGVTFAAGMLNGSNDNSWALPIEIYGVKARINSN